MLAAHEPDIFKDDPPAGSTGFIPNNSHTPQRSGFWLPIFFWGKLRCPPGKIHMTLELLWNYHTIIGWPVISQAQALELHGSDGSARRLQVRWMGIPEHNGGCLWSPQILEDSWNIIGIPRNIIDDDYWEISRNSIFHWNMEIFWKFLKYLRVGRCGKYFVWESLIFKWDLRSGETEPWHGNTTVTEKGMNTRPGKRLHNYGTIHHF